MFRSISRAVAIALCLAGLATTSHAGPKCQAANKLFQGQVTTSEPLLEGDANAVVDCETRSGFATLPSKIGWFQVDMAEEACLSAVSVMLRTGSNNLTELMTDFLAADGSSLIVFGVRYFSEDGVWQRMRPGRLVCGVKSVRVATTYLEQPVSFVEIKAN